MNADFWGGGGVIHRLTQIDADFWGGGGVIHRLTQIFADEWEGADERGEGGSTDFRR